jgi:hypothetical protein
MRSIFCLSAPQIKENALAKFRCCRCPSVSLRSDAVDAGAAEPIVWKVGEAYECDHESCGCLQNKPLVLTEFLQMLIASAQLPTIQARH